VVPLADVMDRMGLAHAYDPGALKVTIDKFYRPSGASTQLRGVASDIVLPSITEVSGVNESKLKDPLPWDTIASASYDRADTVSPYVDVLRQRSARRIAGEEEFAALRGQIARVQKNESTKSVSLNEAERRQDMERAKRDEQAENARSDAHPFTTYQITLENAGAPGLPSPVKFSSAKSKTVAHAADAKNDDLEMRSTDDIELEETLKILADYAALLRPETNAKTSKQGLN
jgi:carboxyl-terminal processing protease